MKAVVRSVLLAFVAVSLVYLIVDEVRGRSAPAVRKTPSDEGGGLQIYVYYFHGNKRCATCRSIEAYAREAIEAGFAEELKSGLMEWRTVNVDEPGGGRYVDMFKLTTRAVVLEEMRGDTQVRWKNLDRVWGLVKDKPAFVTYVQQETRAFLKAGEK